MDLKYKEIVIMRKAKRNKLIILIGLITIACVLLFKSEYSPDLYFLTLYSLEDVSCHYLNSIDALPVITDDFTPPAKSIFFHETSCNGWLNSRQACAVESAAREHPNWQINVFFTGPVTDKDLTIKSFDVLKKYTNINFLRLHLIEYAKGTPLESMIRDGALNRTRWRISHTSDALRFLTLYKWGGVYLDLDVIVVKSFETLAPNWVARESEKYVAAGAIAFSRDLIGRKFADAAINDFKNNFRGDVWPQNGPFVLSRVLKKICKTQLISQMIAENCDGFEVYGPDLFYPIGYLNAKQYFEYFDYRHINFKNPYTYHLWNMETKILKVQKYSLIAQLAQNYCPITYNSYGDNFGE